MIGAVERARQLRSESRARVARVRQAAADAGLAEGGIALRSVSSLQSRDYDAEEAFQQFRGTLYAAIRPIADTVAGQPIRVASQRKPGASRSGRSIKSIRPVEGMTSAVWASTDDGRHVLLPSWLKAIGPELDIHETHPVLDLIDDPNPIMVDWHLLWLTIVNMIVTGKAYWWHTKSVASRHRNGQVLWPLPTSWVTPKHEGRPYSGWTVFPGGGYESKDVPADEIVMFHVPDPSHLLAAKSAAQAQARAIRTDDKMEVCQEALFDNGIFARWALLLGDPSEDASEEPGPPFLPNEMRELVETIIAQRWQGVQRTGQPLLLDALIKQVVKLSNTVQEMDFTGSGEVTYQRITQGVGAHPYVMGKSEPSSRAASAESRRHFSDFTINPRCELIGKVLTKRFAPRFAKPRENLKIWIEPYTPDDHEERRADWELLAKYQSCSRNELRSGVLSLGEMKDGDTIAIPPTQVLIPAEPAKALQRPRVTLLPPSRTPHEAWTKARGAHERRLDGLMNDYFVAQRNELQAKFRKLAASGLAGVPAEAIVAEIFDSTDWDKRLLDAVRPACESAMIDAAQRALSRRRSKQMLELSDLSPSVQAAIQAETETILTQNFSPNINQTTRGKLLETMGEGVAAGDSEYELIVRIGDSPTVPGVVDGVLGSASNTVRASLIARTEGTGIMGAGARAAQDELLQQGLIKAHQWSATLDQYTRAEHAALHGKAAPGPESPDGMFQVGAQRVPYPGHHSLPVEHRANCRCGLTAIFGQIVAEERGPDQTASPP